MQYTRNTTMTKTDRDTLRSLHGRKKWEHIWAYYKLPIAIVLIVVYILGYTAYRHVTKKEDVLYLGLVNITAGSDLTEQLTTGFAEAQGLTKKQQVDLRSFHALSGLNAGGTVLDISDTPFVRQAGFSGRIYLGVVQNAPHPERAAAYIHYLFQR